MRVHPAKTSAQTKTDVRGRFDFSRVLVVRWLMLDSVPVVFGNAAPRLTATKSWSFNAPGRTGHG